MSGHNCRVGGRRNEVGNNVIAIETSAIKRICRVGVICEPVGIIGYPSVECKICGNAGD